MDKPTRVQILSAFYFALMYLERKRRLISPRPDMGKRICWFRVDIQMWRQTYFFSNLPPDYQGIDILDDVKYN